METTATHTPGPWSHAVNGIVQAPEGDDVICRMMSDRWEADARLIAAAPDLLAALLLAADRFDALMDADEATEADVYARRHALEAIAKATQE